MNLKNRIDKIENKIRNENVRYVVYHGKKPDIREPNLVFIDWDILEDGEEYVIFNLTHEEALKELS